MLRRTTAGAAMGALALTAIATGIAPAGAATSAPTPSARPTVTVTSDDPGGSARSLRTSPGHPLARPSGVSASAASTTIATAVVGSLSSQLGTAGDTFRPKAVRRSSAGGDVVRLQQTVSGVPVLGGEVVVDLDPNGATRSVHSETLPSAAPSTTARVPSSLAATRAVAAVVLSTKSRAGDLRTTTPTLAIYDPRIFGAPGAQRATLVWQTTVRSSADRSIDHLVLVDATRGFVTLDLDQLGRGKVLEVCDADSTATEVPCQNAKAPDLFGTADDLYKAWQGAGATYDFYSTYLGRDSVDNAGLKLSSTVRFCPSTTQCPYDNAFWDGAEMVYGAGYPQADDVVAHELTHGVTQYNSGLFYYFQSGAINESLSDIFGEYVDQTDGIGTDTPQAAWQLGEDLAGGRIRDMADPTQLIGGFRQPDRMGSPFYESHTNAGSDAGFDSGGVHGNSGVGNKLGYLLGSSPAVNLTFNGQTLTPLGIPKAAQIIYDASLHLTSGADYRAFASTLRSSCTTLIGFTPLQSATAITQADCDQVTKAILATEMDQVPANVAHVDAAICPTGTVPTTTFSDGMENSLSGNWVRKGGAGLAWPGPPAGSGALWFYGSSDANPYGIPQVYATGGNDNLWGDDPDLSPGATSVFSTHPSSYDGQMVSKALKVPTGASFLRFEHAFGFDSEGSPSTNHDGGRVEYTVNAGATWTDAGPLFSGNGYGFNTGGTANSRLAADNPLPGAFAFTRHSQGYVASRISLASLAGKTVQFRFRITADAVVGDYGWFIDDVRLYSCGPLLNLSVPPSVVFGPTSVTIAANDVSGATSYSYRTRSAKPGVVLSPYVASKPSVSRVIPVPLVAGGGSTCIYVTSTLASPALTSSALRCVSVPVDDRGLTRRGSWTQVRSNGSYAGTATISRTLGSTLTLGSARGSHLVIVATRLVGGGSIGVYVKNRRVALVSLATTGSAKYRQLVDLHLSGLAGVPVVLRVETSGKYVSIDGVAVRP